MLSFATRLFSTCGSPCYGRHLGERRRAGASQRAENKQIFGGATARLIDTLPLEHCPWTACLLTVCQCSMSQHRPKTVPKELTPDPHGFSAILATMPQALAEHRPPCRLWACRWKVPGCQLPTRRHLSKVRIAGSGEVLWGLCMELFALLVPLLSTTRTAEVWPCRCREPAARGACMMLCTLSQHRRATPQRLVFTTREPRGQQHHQRKRK